MKCQILFYSKNKKNITNLSSAESALNVVIVKICSGTHLKCEALLMSTPKHMFSSDVFMHSVAHGIGKVPDELCNHAQGLTSCADLEGPDQLAHARSLIRAFVVRLQSTDGSE